MDRESRRDDSQLDVKLIDAPLSGVLMMRQNIVYASFYMSANED